MVNKPKNIGTWCETKIVRLGLESGFPGADRRPLRGGNQDTGDILLCPGVIAQSKSAKEAPGADMIASWMLKVDKQREASNAEMAFLTVRRYHVNVRLWPTYFWAVDILRMYAQEWDTPPTVIVSMPLASAFLMLRYAGWGTEPK